MVKGMRRNGERNAEELSKECRGMVKGMRRNGERNAEEW